MSNEDKAKFTHIKALVVTALADGKVDDAEKAMLAIVAKREGLSDEEFKQILQGKNKVKYTIPEDEETKINYLKDMATMMIIDGSIDKEELKLCISAAKSFGLSEEKTKEILDEVVLSALTAGADPTAMMAKLNHNEGSKGIEKKPGRYYFYNDLCSFALDENDIISKIVEKDDMKHTLVTKAMPLLIIEIRPCMPNFGSLPVETRNITVAGYPCLEAKMAVTLITHHYINCGNFVVQVDNATEEFLNSFRLEK